MVFDSFKRARALVLGAGLMGALAAPAAAAPGWQGLFTFNVPTGQVNQTITYPCPGTLIGQSGSFAFNSIGQASQVFLTYNGPRVDESPPSFHSWAWHFFWPAGAPAGTVVLLDVNCEKR